MKLAIISHTNHYIKEGKVVGWGPTIREINHLNVLFDEIYHIAPIHKKEAPESSLPYTNSQTNFIPLIPYGGDKISEKVSIITSAPHNLSVIRNVLKKFGKNDWIHFRAPTAMGIYVLPYLSINRKSKLWVKYAGNWNMDKPPLSYSFQKWWLENNFQRSKVTINGNWKNQKEHLIDFKNPCFENKELQSANLSAKKKNFENKLTLCFSGSLTENKGAGILLEALKNFRRKDEIEEVIFAGDGVMRSQYEKSAEAINLNITFRGFLGRKDLEKVYEKSHLIILPSESEGFPKVIAEAAAFGCVPVVSDVSSISQSFNSLNGFLLKDINQGEVTEKLKEAFSNRMDLKKKSEECIKTSSQYTYENYIESLKEKILSD